jgi:carboxypeptidase Q
MLRRRDLACAAALATAGLARAMSTTFDPIDLRVAQQLAEAAQRDGHAARLLTELCTQVGPRPAGSAADAKAVAWAQAAMTDLGLARVRAEALALRIWQRGPASAQLLAPEATPLTIAALGNSVATPAEGITAEVAWYDSLAQLQAEPREPALSRANGRIAFIDEKTARTRDGRGYGAAVMARIAGPVEAARRGALALGIRSIGTDRQRIAHTGAMRYEIGVPRIPAFAVSVPDADTMAERQASGRSLRMALKLDARSDVEATTHNVIGEVPGTDLAHETVLIGAHLDSWDLGQGAQDDGAGVAIVTAAAACIARLASRPRRTVRVVLFGNEENGFDGARAYGDRYGQDPHQWVGESDFGAGRVWRLRSRVRPEALPLVRQMAQLLAPLGVAWSEDAEANQGNPGPDAGVLMRRHQWPAVELSQDGTNYFDVHHTVHDTLDRVDLSTLPQNVACWAVTAWLAAQAPVGFGPLPR